jgi:type II secretory pathway predicted ATPase ExeA
MIRAFFGIDKNPFALDQHFTLLEHQQEVFDILRVHASQGGLCLLMGEPGTGKSILKNAITLQSGKLTMVVNIARTLHTYLNTLRILCHAFNVKFDGSPFRCEKRLIEQAFNLNTQGKALIIVIDDAHLMAMDTLRRIRLLLEDFPKKHNLILVGQVDLLHHMALKVNEDLKSRVTFSVILRKLNPDQMENFILSQLDLANLPHNIFTENALSADGILRKARNLALSCMLEAVRSQKKAIDIDNVNRVLIQPHWRIETDITHIV